MERGNNAQSMAFVGGSTYYDQVCGREEGPDRVVADELFSALPDFLGCLRLPHIID